MSVFGYFPYICFRILSLTVIREALRQPAPPSPPPLKAQRLEVQNYSGHIHSPREIISTMCKTGQDALRKRKPCRKLFIHISNKSASNKLTNVSMESSKLLCLNGTSFCSKSCKLETFPLSIASVLTFAVDGPRL